MPKDTRVKNKPKRRATDKSAAFRKEWSGFLEVNTNKDGRLACMFGTPVDDHEDCRWCKADAAIRLFNTISVIRRNIGAERWHFEDFVKTHGDSRVRVMRSGERQGEGAPKVAI
jgi:hypothetical protein